MGCPNSKAPAELKAPQAVAPEAVKVKVDPNAEAEAAKKQAEEKAQQEAKAAETKAKEPSSMKAPSSTDPAAVIKAIVEELNAKAKECGTDAVEAIIKNLEEIKEKAKAGPGRIFDELESNFKKLTGKIESAIKDPSSLVTADGPVAALATWYGTEVCTKLKDLMKEVEEAMAMAKKNVASAAEPLSKIGDGLKASIEGMAGSASKLLALPNELKALGETVKGPADLAKLEMESIKKCVDLSSLDAVLSTIGSVKSYFAAAVDAITRLVEKIVEFLISLADKILHAFDVPQPLCFLTSMVLSQAPPIVKELMDMVEALKKLELQPALEGIKKMKSAIDAFDPKAVKEPLDKFSLAAKPSIDKLDKAVAAAKLSSNPLGAIGSLFGK